MTCCLATCSMSGPREMVVISRAGQLFGTGGGDHQVHDMARHV